MWTQGRSTLLKNLWKCFRSKALFCCSISITPRPPSGLGLQTNFQAAFGGFLSWMSEPLQTQCFLYLSSCFITVLGKARVHMEKVGREEKTALVIWSLPAWLRKGDRPIRRFSHLLSKGRKSWIFWSRDTQRKTKVSERETSFWAAKGCSKEIKLIIRNIDRHHHRFVKVNLEASAKREAIKKGFEEEDLSSISLQDDEGIISILNHRKIRRWGQRDRKLQKA